MYQQIVKITDEDANKIPLYFPNQYFAAKNSLKGVRVIDNCYYPWPVGAGNNPLA